MTIEVGSKMPSGTLRYFAEGMHEVSTDELFAGKKIVLFGVPGAFTPTCNDTHLPGFMVNADKIREAGADDIVCMAVNDPFVLAAWAKATGTGDHIRVLSDGSADYANALGLTLDLSGIGFGVRSARFAAIVDDGELKYLGVEPGKEVTVSGADAVLENL